MLCTTLQLLHRRLQYDCSVSLQLNKQRTVMAKPRFLPISSLNLIRANSLFRILQRHCRKSLHDVIHIQGIKAAPKITVYPGGNITYSN